MYFTLAVSAASREVCAALTGTALDADPRVMPIPGPARVAWRAADERQAVVHWGSLADGTGPAGGPGPAEGAASWAGTIWAEASALRARTGLARVDPVYLAEVPGAVVVSDRASWAATATGPLGDYDPVMLAALLSLGYPVGAATPFHRVRALGPARALEAVGGRLVVTRVRSGGSAGTSAPSGGGPADLVAAALVAAVRPLRGVPVELSLTGGKDSRLIAAALTAAQVPFRARTHGMASHPDVVVAALIAERLGVEHVVTEPRPPGSHDETELLGRLRATVLVADGMLSAFENVGWPDPEATAEPVQTGGHGGELLRGGYAQAAWRSRSPVGAWGAAAGAWNAAAGTELFRRMTTRRMGLLHPAAAGRYLAGFAPSVAALRRGPLHALDDFYLENRAGRWSAAARQAYLLRSPLVQPFFSDRVVAAARAVPLRDRITDRLPRQVLAVLGPELADIPLAGSGWKGSPRTPRVSPPRPASQPDWRQDSGEEMARFLREYALDLGAAGGLFGVVRRRAAEQVLRSPLADPHAAWALATMAALVSGDWLNARAPARAGGNAGCRGEEVQPRP
jgi:asparagine synthase (glutamine-hydrolysing)